MNDLMTNTMTADAPLAATRACFCLADGVPAEDVDGMLRLARLAAESLLGPSRVALEARYAFDAAAGLVDFATGTEAGRTIALVFGGYVQAAFGAEAVRLVVVPPPLGGVSLAGGSDGGAVPQ